jgi:phage recombination protein Bet
MPKKRKPVPRQRPRKPATTAIVPVAPSETIVRRRELHFSREQIDLIKENVAKGTTDEQLQLFLYVCKKHRLDPLVKQVYCVLWPRDNGKFHDMVIITGINGFRSTAARDHKDFAGTSKPVFTYQDTIIKTPAGRRIPDSCSMKAFRKGFPEAAAEVEIFWSEFAPTDLSAKRSDFWNRLPRHMLAKVAEAQVLRKAFPDLADVYVEEEVAQRMADFTPGGREITTDGVNPSGRVADPQYGSREASQRVLGEKLAARSDTPPIDVKTSQRQPESQRPRRHATLDWSNPQDPLLTGDIQDLVPQSKAPYGLLKGLNVTLGKDGFWHVALYAVKDLRQVCAEAGYDLTELHPKGSGPKKEAPVAAKTSAPASGAGAKPSATEPTLVSGTIERTNMGMAGKSPVKYVTLVKVDKTKPTLGCFHKSMWDEIEKGLGKFATFRVVTKGNYTNIEGLVKIGNREWLEDGTPAIQNNTREAGMKTLF